MILTLTYWKEPHKISRQVAREVLMFQNTTLKYVTSKEWQTEEQMPYQRGQTMIKEQKTTKKSSCYQNTYLPRQQKEFLVNEHKMKKLPSPMDQLIQPEKGYGEMV
jgi:Zn-dependent peptidase ImmA (M78 family)